MANNDRDLEPGGEVDLAIERALEGANLRAGDATSTSTAYILEDREVSAAEAGGAEADGD